MKKFFVVLALVLSSVNFAHAGFVLDTNTISQRDGLKLSCQGIEGEVIYKGRKVYNGVHTRYYKYQNVETNEMFKPKKKPHCVIVGVSLKKLAEIEAKEKKAYEERKRTESHINFVFLFLLSVVIMFFIGYNER